MQQQRDDGAGWHRGPRIDVIPVAGVGGLIFAVGMVVMFVGGMPYARWFFIGSLPAGLLAFVLIRLLRKLRPKTEEEETQLNVGGQMRQP